MNMNIVVTEQMGWLWQLQTSHMPSTLPKMANINRLNRHCFYLNTAYFIVGEKPTGFTSIL